MWQGTYPQQFEPITTDLEINRNLFINKNRD